MHSNRPAKSQAPTVVFDFDGTLWRGDSVGDFLRWRLLSNPLRALPALLLLPLLWPWLRGSIANRGRAASVLLWLATAGMNELRFHHAISQFAQRYASDPSKWQQNIVAAVDQHLRDNEQPIIATAAFTPLARALLELRWKQLPVVGSSVRRWAGGWVAGHHLHGAHKIQALINAGHRPPFAHIYSDSRDDQPLADNALIATWVDPNSGHMHPWRATD